MTTTGTVIELDKDSFIHPLSNILMEGSVKASFPMIVSDGQKEGDAAAEEAKAAEAAKKQAEEEQRQQELAEREEKGSWKDTAKRIGTGLAKIAVGLAIGAVAVLAVPALLTAAVGATIGTAIAFAAATVGVALTAAVYTPGYISEGLSDIGLGIKGDFKSEAVNPVKNAMDGFMGEGTYANWGNTMMTLSSMTFFSAIAIEQAVFMSMFAYNYYSPQINNVLNSGADKVNNVLNNTMDMLNPSRTGELLLAGADGYVHSESFVVAGSTSITIPIANPLGLSQVSSLASEAIAMMASNSNGLSGGAGSSNANLPNDFSKKPLNSPDPKKWVEKGGTVEVNDGVWKYTNKDGISVNYKNGYPDFKEAGLVKKEVDIGTFTNRTSDFKLAEQISPKSPNSTWHHHEDGKTLQEIDAYLHQQFTHRGGISNLNK